MSSIAPAAGAAAIENRIGFYYTVQEGDTLWGISEKFFDTPSKWPDLWKDNSHIANPHWIEPGTRVLIYRTTDAETARISKTIRLPGKQTTGQTTGREQEAVSGKDAYYLLFSPIDRTGFIREKPVEASGIIFQTEEDVQLVGVDDLVFIRKDKPEQFDIGKRFTVYRPINLNKHSLAIKYNGYHHYPTGVVEIIDNKSDYAVAKVIESYRTILREDRLVPHIDRSPEIPIADSKEGIDGKIIGSEEHELSFGDHSVAFIDKGQQDGIEPGQKYSLYLKREVRLDGNKRKNVALRSFDIGTMYVLHTEEATATVLIMMSQRPVSSTTRYRTPAP